MSPPASQNTSTRLLEEAGARGIHVGGRAPPELREAAWMRFVAAFGPGAFGQGRAVQPLGQGAGLGGAGSWEPEPEGKMQGRCGTRMDRNWAS